MNDKNIASVVEEKREIFKKNANAARNAGEKRTAFKRKVRSDDSNNQSRYDIKMAKNNQGRKVLVRSEPKPGCSKDLANQEDDNLRVAVVDELSEDGRLTKDLWLDVELQLITHVAMTPEAPGINIGKSEWKKGRKIITCEDLNTANYLRDLIPKLKLKAGDKVKLKGVKESELHKYIVPEATVWIPTPHIPQEILIPALKNFNPLLDTNSWRILHAGTKQESGQLWTIRLNKECLSQLQKDYCVVRFGAGKVVFRLPGVQHDKYANCTDQPPTQ